MRTNEFTGVYHMHEEISPEAYKSQRLQELKDLAEWRQRHLAQITEWSSEEKRLERIAKHLVEEAASRATWKPDEHLNVIGDPTFRVTPIKRPNTNKKSWWAKLWGK